ncbi:MAG: ParB/RepB/Spo0J family partition protein [Abditibacteriota bacterium]|nr:ParB/RepB/Spo0J family partition protein [Abditibacteriota bacterium]
MPKLNEGSGLNALIGRNNILNQENSIENLPLDLIDPNPYQPRKTFDEEKLQELSNNIKKHGVLQPILVRKKPDNRYELIAGERRFRASKLAGLLTIPVNIKVLNDKESLEIALIENIQREDINSVETAMGYKRLMDEFAYTQENLSFIIGKSRSAIANTLRLLTLPQSVMDMITRKELTEGHGRAILSVPEDRREEFANYIVEKGLSVRRAEEEAENFKPTQEEGQESKKTTKYVRVQPYISNAKRFFTSFFKVKVKISEREGKGKITIPFDSQEELNSIISILKEKK